MIMVDDYRFFIQLIIERSSLPTFSIRPRLSVSLKLLNTGRFAWFSTTHSRANCPDWISFRIFRISARVSSVMILGPLVRSPYSAVSLIEYRIPAIKPL